MYARIYLLCTIKLIINIYQYTMEKLEIKNLITSDYINKQNKQTRLFLRNEFCQKFGCTNYIFNKKIKENSFDNTELEFIVDFVENLNDSPMLKQYYDLTNQQKMSIRTKFCCLFECSEPTFYHKLRHGFKKYELVLINQMISSYGKV